MSPTRRRQKGQGRARARALHSTSVRCAAAKCAGGTVEQRGAVEQRAEERRGLLRLSLAAQTLC